jgi:hypothetical protein
MTDDRDLFQDRFIYSVVTQTLLDRQTVVVDRARDKAAAVLQALAGRGLLNSLR